MWTARFSFHLRVLPEISASPQNWLKTMARLHWFRRNVLFMDRFVILATHFSPCGSSQVGADQSPIRHSQMFHEIGEIVAFLSAPASAKDIILRITGHLPVKKETISS